MFRWMAMTIFQAAAVIFASNRLQMRKHLIVKTSIALIVESILYAGLCLAGQESFFLAALLLGQAGCLVCDAGRNQEMILPELAIFLCADGLLLPLCLCGGAIWQYVLYLAVCLFGAAISPVYEKNHIAGLLKFYPGRKKIYMGVSVLPCGILLPEILLACIFAGEKLVSPLPYGMDGHVDDWRPLWLCGTFVLLSFLILWLQQEVLERIEAREFGRAMERWQQESRDYMNTVRSQRHDFNLHLHAIAGLVNGGEYEKCGEYVRKLVSEANDVNDIMPVNDAVVGSMLYNMREEARARGTDIVYDITYDMKDIFCNGFECNKIIGNLLQNALDALQTDEDKAYGIKLSIFKRRGNTVIVSENRFHGDVDRIARVFEAGYSTKKGHEGIGLSMVLRTAALYGGRVYPEFDRDVIRFVVNIPNKIRLPEGEEGRGDSHSDFG